MSEFEEISKSMASATVAGPADDETIDEAEELLGIQFPPSYRLFLSVYGAALCDGFEIAGIIKKEDSEKPPLWMDVVTSNQQIRRALRGDLPEGYVMISDDGSEYTFYLDTAHRESSGECPVVVLGPGVDSIQVATDFIEFVLRASSGRIVY